MLSNSMKTVVLSIIATAIALPLYAGPETAKEGKEVVAPTTAAKVDINQATADQLIALPRIGPRVAERVIEYRKQNGGFRTVDELTNVRGIGAKMLESLRPLVTVGKVADPPAVTKPTNP